jgi:hypothetical protein
MLIQIAGDSPLELYLMFAWVLGSLAILYVLQRWWTSYK